MAALELTHIELRVGPNSPIRADIKDWVSDPGPSWPGMAMHAGWLHIGDLTFAFPQESAAQLEILERLAAAVATLVADARAQMAPAAELPIDDMAPGEIVGVFGK